MSRYPRSVRGSALKCIDCNAPVVETVDGGFACVDCGESPISAKNVGPRTSSAD